MTIYKKRIMLHIPHFIIINGTIVNPLPARPSFGVLIKFGQHFNLSQNHLIGW